MSIFQGHRIPILPVICLIFGLIAGCRSKKAVTGSTLELRVTFNDQRIVPVDHKISQDPYYRNETSTPLYKAVLLDNSEHQIGSVLFDNSIFMGKGNVYVLPFPNYNNLHRIVLYELNSNSGHITNKNHKVVLNWIVPPAAQTSGNSAKNPDSSQNQ